MAEHPMETTLCTALWQQFGAAIAMLENALVACPIRSGRSISGSTLRDHNMGHSGISLTTLSAGSTCISQAKQKDSPPLRTSGTRLTPKANFPNKPIPEMSYTPI